jgi:hypothetical protein
MLTRLLDLVSLFSASSARFAGALAVLAAAMLFSQAAFAQSALYAVDGAGTGGGGGGGGPSTLYLLDAQTGAVIQEIGPTGFYEVSGISFDPVTGVLYGVANGSDELITIDIVTGAGTAIGLVGAGGKVPDLGFAPSGILYGWTEGFDDLITIDITTGSGTVEPPRVCRRVSARRIRSRSYSIDRASDRRRIRCWDRAGRPRCIQPASAIAAIKATNATGPAAGTGIAGLMVMSTTAASVSHKSGTPPSQT